jgi:hypothetical protein
MSLFNLVHTIYLNSEGRGAQESATQRKQAAQQVHAARQRWRRFDRVLLSTYGEPDGAIHIYLSIIKH